MVTQDAVLAALFARMAGPIVWGVSDCCHAACDVFADLHGVDAMAPLRGRYRSQRGALRLIRQHGGWVAMCRGLAARARLRAGVGAPGELALMHNEGQHTLGVALGNGLAAGRVEGGFATARGIVMTWAHG